MKLFKRIEAIFLAATFAEEGEADTARRILEEHGKTERPDEKKELPVRKTVAQRPKHDI